MRQASFSGSGMCHSDSHRPSHRAQPPGWACLWAAAHGVLGPCASVGDRDSGVSAWHSVFFDDRLTGVETSPTTPGRLRL